MEHYDPNLRADEIAAIASRIDRSIVLVGMMGVGKSSVGRKLAHVLGWPFVDADQEIEHAAQMSISEIFEAFGEDGFRDGERRVIARLIASGRQVIATGGGAFVNAQTRQLLLESAIAVWLDSDLDTLVERVGRKDSRPLLRTGDPREILARLQEERRPAYAQAPIHVTSKNGPHGRAVNEILRELATWR